MIIRSTVTGKNQITIPTALARELNIEPGMQVDWEINEDRKLVISPVLSREERLRQIEEKWKDLFPPGSDPVGDLIRERDLEDEEWG